MELVGFEPTAFRMQSGRATTALKPLEEADTIVRSLLILVAGTRWKSAADSLQTLFCLSLRHERRVTVGDCPIGRGGHYILHPTGAVSSRSGAQSASVAASPL